VAETSAVTSSSATSLETGSMTTELSGDEAKKTEKEEKSEKTQKSAASSRSATSLKELAAPLPLPSFVEESVKAPREGVVLHSAVQVVAGLPDKKISLLSRVR